VAVLVLGMCFFAGGTRFAEQGFLASEFRLQRLSYSGFQRLTSPYARVGAANVNSSLLTLSVIALLIPAAFVMAINSSLPNGQPITQTLTTAQEGAAVLKMSRGVSAFDSGE
jgi:Ca2+:H+ antiporter